MVNIFCLLGLHRYEIKKIIEAVTFHKSYNLTFEKHFKCKHCPKTKAKTITLFHK
jgi:hypothetical protein